MLIFFRFMWPYRALRAALNVTYENARQYIYPNYFMKKACSLSNWILCFKFSHEPLPEQVKRI